jgi:hypothetical protein
VTKTKKSYRTSQPIHSSSQVKNRDELRIGRLYIQIRAGEPFCELLITKVDEDSFEFRARKINSDDFVSEGRASMTDNGILPYESGLWNPDNWLEPVEKNYGFLEDLLGKFKFVVIPINQITDSSGKTEFEDYPFPFRIQRK